MTIGEAISEFKEMIPSAPDDSVLVKWLSEIEGTAIKEVILTHSGAPAGAKDFCGFKYTDKKDTKLFVSEPFCRLYCKYMAMKYYIAVCDIQRYNTFAGLFFNSYSNFADSYNREHKPLSNVLKFRF